MSQRCDENNVGIPRIDDHLADGSRIFQPDVLPGFSGVHRLPNAVALRNVPANAGLARTHVNRVRFGLGHGQATDRRRSVFFEDWRPGCRAIGRLPYTTARRAKVVGRRIARNTCCRQRPTATKRPDAAILHALEERIAFVLFLFFVLVRLCGRRSRCLLVSLRFAVPLFSLWENRRAKQQDQQDKRCTAHKDRFCSWRILSSREKVVGVAYGKAPARNPQIGMLAF